MSVRNRNKQYCNQCRISFKRTVRPCGHNGNERTSFHPFGQFRLQDSLVEGQQTATVAPDGSVVWNGDKYAEIIFEATSPECVFELEDVVIGVNFHWERKENQRFKGDLKLIGGKTVTAIDIVPVEDYLASVISSEMSATASLELLKAHAVISRSWLLAQLDKRGAKAAPSKMGNRHRTHRMVRPRQPRPVRCMRRRPLPALPGHNPPDNTDSRPGRGGNTRTRAYKQRRRPLRRTLLQMLRRRV